MATSSEVDDLLSQVGADILGISPTGVFQNEAGRMELRILKEVQFAPEKMTYNLNGVWSEKWIRLNWHWFVTVGLRSR
jgi:hypothetical protein